MLLNARLGGLLVFAIVSISAVWVQAAGAATLRLTWKSNSTNETGFQIQRWSGVSYTQIAQVGAKTHAYSDQTVVAGVRYCYRVRAVNSSGASSFSNESCVTAPQAAKTSTSTTTTTAGTSTPSSSSPTTQPSSTANGSNGAVPSAASWTNYRFSVKIRSADQNLFGVIFRYVDAQNYYRFTWNQKSPSRQLLKVRNGIATVLAAEAVPYRTGQTYQFEAIVNGPAISVSIDGRQVFSVSDSSFDKGGVGFYSSYNKGAFFDDVLVENLDTGSVLLKDDFNNGSFTGWTIMDETTQGGPSAWSVINGQLAQMSKVGFYDSANPWRTPGTVAVYSQRDWSDYRFNVKLRSDDDDLIGVIFRYVDDNNYYRFTWNQESPSRQIQKIKDGVATVLTGDAVPYRSGQTYHIQVVVNGPAITLFIDSQQVFSVKDSTFDRGTIALYCSFNEGCVYDDVVIEDVHNGSVLLKDDFDNGNFTGWTIIDETNQGGPSAWLVIDGRFVQRSNIGLYDNKNPWRAPGTLAIYSK